jgi:hypothetical protein
MIKFLNNSIKNPDHFSWKVNELVVDIAIEFSQMDALDDKDFGFSDIKFCQLIAINLLWDELAFDFINHFELLDEINQRAFSLSRRDSSTINEIGAFLMLEVGGVSDLMRSAVAMVMSRVGLMKGMRAVHVGTGVVHGSVARKDRVRMVPRLLH